MPKKYPDPSQEHFDLAWEWIEKNHDKLEKLVASRARTAGKHASFLRENLWDCVIDQVPRIFVRYDNSRDVDKFIFSNLNWYLRDTLADYWRDLPDTENLDAVFRNTIIERERILKLMPEEAVTILEERFICKKSLRAMGPGSRRRIQWAVRLFEFAYQVIRDEDDAI